MSSLILCAAILGGTVGLVAAMWLVWKYGSDGPIDMEEPVDPHADDVMLF